MLDYPAVGSLVALIANANSMIHSFMSAKQGLSREDLSKFYVIEIILALEYLHMVSTIDTRERDTFPAIKSKSVDVVYVLEGNKRQNTVIDHDF